MTAFADQLRRAGHTVHTPDLFDGRTFATVEDGKAYARGIGFGALVEKGVAVAEGLSSPAVVYAGFSFGVMPAQQLAQTRPDARGALLLHGCAPVSEFGERWPEGVPVQVHAMDADPFFAEDDGDLAAAQESAPLEPVALDRGDRPHDGVPELEEVPAALVLSELDGQERHDRDRSAGSRQRVPSSSASITRMPLGPRT